MSFSESLKEKLEEFLNRLVQVGVTKYVLTTHEHADLDAVASICIFRDILSAIRSDIETKIFWPKVSQHAISILEKLNIRISLNEEEVPRDKYVVVLLDISDPNRFLAQNLVDLVSNSYRIFAIDHHNVGDVNNVEILYIPLSSTTEILLSMAEHLGILDQILQKNWLATLATVAIITDTAFFSTASPTTFYFMNKLLPLVDYPNIIRVLRAKKYLDVPEKMAILKALQRTIIRKINNTIIVITHVGSYESLVANTILQLGGDIAFVISKKKEQGKKIYRIIVRSKTIGITHILSSIAKRLEGTFGTIDDRIGGIQITKEIKLDKLKRILLEEVLENLLPMTNHNERK